VVLLGRLAVDTRYRGRRLGELVLLDALKRALRYSSQIAALAVVVDAIDETAASFYERYGFQHLTDDPRRLFIAMKTIEDVLL
jgi:predicted GNAT family N-acyltransferase